MNENRASAHFFGAKENVLREAAWHQGFPLFLAECTSVIAIGENGNDGAHRVDYAQALARQALGNKKGDYREGKPVSSADFDQNYEPISPTYPGHVPGTVTVGNGDTLHSLAERLWGDKSMWYLLADANGLSGSEQLTSGTSLIVPNKVTNFHNNSDTFRVYDPEEATGDVSPTLPEPPPPPQPKKKRGGFRRFVSVLSKIVAVAITVVMTAYFGVPGAIVGGALGSIVSQAGAIYAGEQSKFSWKAVGMSAAASGLTAGLLQGAQAGTFGQTIKAGVVEGATFGQQLLSHGVLNVAGNVITQGANRLVGMQKGFDWRSVAASGASTLAGIGMVKVPGLGGQSLTAGTLRGMATGFTQAGVNRGKFDFASIAASAFGSALGNGLVESQAKRQQQEIEQKETAKKQPFSGRRMLEHADNSSQQPPMALQGNRAGQEVVQESAGSRKAVQGHQVNRTVDGKVNMELLGAYADEMFSGLNSHSAATLQGIGERVAGYNRLLDGLASQRLASVSAYDPYTQIGNESVPSTGFVDFVAGAGKAIVNGGIGMLGEYGKGLLAKNMLVNHAAEKLNHMIFGGSKEPKTMLQLTGQINDLRSTNLLKGVELSYNNIDQRNGAMAFDIMSMVAGGVGAAKGLYTLGKMGIGAWGARNTNVIQGISGKLVGEYTAVSPGALSSNLAETFSGGRYKTVVLSEDTVLYRAGTSQQGLGQFFSVDKPVSVIQTRIEKAILPTWPNGAKSPLDAVFGVKIPKGTTVHIGEVGTQQGFYVGGTQQIVVPTPWKIPGVEIISKEALK